MRPLLVSAVWLFLLGTIVADPSPPPPPAPATAPKAEASVSELMARARPSIVTITQIGRGGGQEALGAGFIISADGLVATNRHVIGNARRIQVKLSDGTVHEVVSVHATDPVLDLAIIRIDQTNLHPLPLGDSDTVKQGTEVIAIGHPQGLQFSVVQGVVSAIRDVEGIQMFQVAIPIEEGNSGGPLLDRQGRVQGIVTLKSAVTENLGFAHTAAQLKRLVEKPNPIAMSRWLTIGVLDRHRWEPVLGGRWTQHAGVIHVDESGGGGFGRALCLSKETEPQTPYEVAVTVKLDDESGAAGLAFCSDGGDHHYGFYPSAGRMRLTRFMGPDVTSWNVLAEVPTPAYRRGQWNTLRVRVEKDKILCYVNDKLVTEHEDNLLRGGQVGLCKFRHTRADFKSFRVGENLASQDLPQPLASELQLQVDDFLKERTTRDKAITKLLAEPAAARRVLEDRVTQLEEQASSLRKLQREVHRQSVTAELVKLLRRPADQTELLRAALLIAKHDNPEVDVPSYLRMMDRMVDDLKDDPALKQSPAAAVARLSKYLFDENGFHGSRDEDMRDAANSHLDEVLDDREGIPITLSIVYLELARRLNLKDVYGVSLPGRFMVAFDDTVKGQKLTHFIDVFDHGKILERLQVEGLIFRTDGAAVDDNQLAPATPRAMILRMLSNLVSFGSKPSQGLPYMDMILAIDPDAHIERYDRAVMRVKANDMAGAKADLEKLLEDQPSDVNMERVDILYHSLP